MCRVQIVGMVERAIRLVCALHRSNKRTKASRRSAVSRETGVSRSAASRSAARSDAAISGWAVLDMAGLAASGRGAALVAPADIRDQQRQRRRRDAVDAAGLAD